jgi:hypothetical protein
LTTLAHVFAHKHHRVQCHACRTMGDVTLPTSDASGGDSGGYAPPPNYDPSTDPNQVTNPWSAGINPDDPNNQGGNSILTPNPSDVGPSAPGGGGGGGYSPSPYYSPPSPSSTPTTPSAPGTIAGLSTSTLAIGAGALVLGYMAFKKKTRTAARR